MSFQTKTEYVLISDEDEDDALEKPSPTTRPGAGSSNESKVHNQDQTPNFASDDGDRRRVSRRRKNRNENTDEIKDTKNNEQSRAGRSNSNSNDHTNDSSKNSSSTNSYERKYGHNENRAETRSRKRERSPSPIVADVKETESISYKEVLSGLEGAAFQSRYVLSFESVFSWIHINKNF